MNNFLIFLLVIACMIVSAVVYAVTLDAEASQAAVKQMVAETDCMSEPDSQIAQGTLKRHVESTAKQMRLADLESIDAQSHPVESVGWTGGLPVQKWVKQDEKPIRLTIRSDKKKVGVFTATFTNKSDNVVQILKPVDGSMYSWLMPNYDMVATDRKGEKVALMDRCGNCGVWGAEWPGEFLQTIETGQNFELQLAPPLQWEPGETYQVQLNYIYQFDGTEKQNSFTAGADLSKPVNGIWQGKLQSNKISITFNKDAEQAENDDQEILQLPSIFKVEPEQDLGK